MFTAHRLLSIVKRWAGGNRAASGPPYTLKGPYEVPRSNPHKVILKVKCNEFRRNRLIGCYHAKLVQLIFGVF